MAWFKPFNKKQKLSYEERKAAAIAQLRETEKRLQEEQDKLAQLKQCALISLEQDKLALIAAARSKLKKK